MAEAAGLVLGALGIAGLFKSCVDNFDIIVRAREFSEEFDLLCTELSLQQIRLVLWGESLGFVPAVGKTKPLNHQILEGRPQVCRAIADSLLHLQNLLTKADVITGRYDYQETPNDDDTAGSTSRGMVIFRDTFQKFKSRLNRNQAQKSTWKVTRWSVHDYGKFRELITSIKNLLDGLESITSTLGLLERQRTSLIEEIESISDTESLRLLQIVGSTVAASPVLRLVSDRASQRMSDVTSGKRSYHTAPTHLSGSSALSGRVDTLSHLEPEQSVKTQIHADATQSSSHDTPDIPQNQRWILALYGRTQKSEHPQKFTSSDQTYGQKLASIKQSDEKSWAARSATFLTRADHGMSLAQRAFLELRSIRRADVPFISAAPVGDSLGRLLASVEGPPGTPYEGGVFWITVKIVPRKPPLLRFQTRIYHPNINCTGELCADYDSWWTNLNLSSFISSRGYQGSPWFSEHRTSQYSLGALLVSICGLLSSPNVDDPLVPEIAEKYITEYDEYFEAAKSYTAKYAKHERPPEDELLFVGDVENPLPKASEPRKMQDYTDSSSLFGQVSATDAVDLRRAERLALLDIKGESPLTCFDLLSPGFLKAIRRSAVATWTTWAAVGESSEDVVSVLGLSQEECSHARLALRYFNGVIDNTVQLPKMARAMSLRADMTTPEATSTTIVAEPYSYREAVAPILQKLHEWAIVLEIASSTKEFMNDDNSILEFEIEKLEETISKIDRLLTSGYQDWAKVMCELDGMLSFISRSMRHYALVDDEQHRHIRRSTPGATFAWPNALGQWYFVSRDQPWAAACYKELLPVMSGEVSLKDYNQQFQRGSDTWAGVNEVTYEFRLFCGYLLHVSLESLSKEDQQRLNKTSRIFTKLL